MRETVTAFISPSFRKNNSIAYRVVQPYINRQPRKYGRHTDELLSLPPVRSRSEGWWRLTRSVGQQLPSGSPGGQERQRQNQDERCVLDEGGAIVCGAVRQRNRDRDRVIAHERRGDRPPFELC